MNDPISKYYRKITHKKSPDFTFKFVVIMIFLLLFPFQVIHGHQLTAPLHALYVLVNSTNTNTASRLCSFELNEEIVFEELCNHEITIVETHVMVIGSGQFFVYALNTNSNSTEFNSNDVWNVYWNEEAYANHAHTSLGVAKLVSETCLHGDNFIACIE